MFRDSYEKKSKASRAQSQDKAVSKRRFAGSLHPAAIISGEVVLGEGDIVAFNGR